jgi:hypothetical protein
MPAPSRQLGGIIRISWLSDGELGLRVLVAPALLPSPG